MKRIRFVLIAALLLIGVASISRAGGVDAMFPVPDLSATIALPGSSPAFMSYEGMVEMLSTVGPEAGATLVFDAVSILDVDPVARLPQTIYILHGRDLVITRIPEEIEVTATLPGAQAPAIDYHIPFKSETIKDFLPATNPWPTVLAIAVAALGASISDSLLPLPPVAKELASAGVGAAAGGLTLLLF